MPFGPRLLLPVLSALTGSTLGQAPVPAPPDPYTGGAPAALQELGYRSLGPFPWGAGISTRGLERVLGTALRWVETEHFKVGCGLETWALAGPTRERRKIQAELGDLRNVLRTVRVRTRRLDPWLRLHLFARRAERLYADFAGRIDAREVGFGEKLGSLGERGKFCLLLLQRESDLGRYLRCFPRLAGDGPLCHSFFDTGSRVFVTCAEREGGGWMSDTALHCEAVYGLMLNMLATCTGDHDSPLWWREGLCHWYQRRIDPRYDSVTVDDHAVLQHPRWNWPPQVRARARSGAYPDAATAVGWRDMGEVGQTGHMFAWSRVDFLMTEKGEGLSRFLCRIRSQWLSPSRSRAADNVEWHRDAVEDAFGLTLEEFDEQWLAFVHRYPSR